MIKVATAVTLMTLVAAGSLRHLTLVDSAPKEDAVLTQAPHEILLKFNERPDSTRRGISLRGPDGPVKLGKVRTIEDTLAFAASIDGDMRDGRYTVSWLAAAPDHAAIRGRFRFTVQTSSR